MTNETNTAQQEQENPQTLDALKGNKITAKIHLACRSNDDVSHLQHIIIKECFAYASNGIIAVKVDLRPFFQVEPSLLDMLDGKIIHRDQFALMYNNDIVDVTDTSFTILTKKDVRIEMLFPDQSELDSKLPEIDKVIENALNSEKTYEGEDIGINPEALQKISESMIPKGCYKNLRLKFRAADKAIIVTSSDSGMDDLIGNSMAIIMPSILDHP